jgi:ribosomal protein L2
MISFSNDSSKDAIFFYKQATTEDAFLKFQIKNFQKQLQFFEIGDYLNNISLLLKKNPVFARSSGSYGILLRKQSIKKDYVTVKLPSNKIRLIHREAFASPGQVSLSLIRTKKLYKAGQSR